MGLLPENKRTPVESIQKRRIWIYGQSGHGKTYLADKFPNVLMLNTDGNCKYFSAPSLLIRDTKEGRVDKMAWENFKAVIDELAMKQNTYETLVIDLLDDLYQYCRRYVLKKNGFIHESDVGFGKGWTLVDDEFFDVINKLNALDYETIIYISLEERGEVTKPNGEKVTTVGPNLRDKITLQVGRMVDFAGRLVADGDTRTITIKPSQFQYAVGRAEFQNRVIPASYEGIEELFKNINNNATPKAEPENTIESRRKINSGE